MEHRRSIGRIIDMAIASLGRGLLWLAGEAQQTVKVRAIPVKWLELPRSLAPKPLLPPAKIKTAEDWVREAIREGITSYRKIRKWIIEHRGIGVSFSTISKVLQNIRS
jgi:hypothetical protein